MKLRLPRILTRDDWTLLRHFERVYGRPWRMHQWAMAGCMILSSLAMSGLIVMMAPPLRARISATFT